MRWGTSTIYKNRILKVKKSLLEFNKDFEESKDRKLRNRLILTDIFCEVTFCKTFFCTSKNFFDQLRYSCQSLEWESVLYRWAVEVEVFFVIF